MITCTKEITRRRGGRGLSSLLGLPLLAAVALPASATVAWAADRDESRIETRLKKESDLKDVRVKYDRVVTLTGKVASESERLKAERLANVSGVTRVDNQIEVRDSRANDRRVNDSRAPDKTKDRIDDHAEAAKDRVQDRADAEKNRIDRVAEARKEHVDEKHQAGKATISEDISDAWVTTKLKSQYTTEGVFHDSTIHVDTDRDGVVTLTGVVASEVAHARAVEVARTTKGVRDVRDNLKVAR